jgi:hypothetical protein
MKNMEGGLGIHRFLFLLFSAIGLHSIYNIPEIKITHISVCLFVCLFVDRKGSEWRCLFVLAGRKCLTGIYLTEDLSAEFLAFRSFFDSPPAIFSCREWSCCCCLDFDSNAHVCVCVSRQLKIIMCILFYFIFTHFDLVAGRALFLPMSYIPRPLLPLHYNNNNNNYLLLVFVFFFPSSPGRQRRRRLFG